MPELLLSAACYLGVAHLTHGLLCKLQLFYLPGNAPLQSSLPFYCMLHGTES